MIPVFSVATGNRSASSFEHDVAAAVKEVFGMEIFGFDYLVDDTTGTESIPSAASIEALLRRYWCAVAYTWVFPPEDSMIAHAGLFNIVDVNHLPSLKFPGAQQALWTLCTKAHKAGCRAKGYAASHMHVQ